MFLRSLLGLTSGPNFSSMSIEDLNSYAKNNFSVIEGKNKEGKKNSYTKKKIRNQFLKQLEVKIRDLNTSNACTPFKIGSPGGKRCADVVTSTDSLYNISVAIAHVAEICDLLKPITKNEIDKIRKIETSMNKLNKKVKKAITPVINVLKYDVDTAVSQHSLEKSYLYQNVQGSLMYGNCTPDYTHTCITEINATILKTHEICKNLSRDSEFKSLDEKIIEVNEKWGNEVIAFKKRRQ